MADLFGIVNVPTVLWIDEDGRIVRPKDTVFVTDTYEAMTGISAAAHVERIRRWVRTGEGGMAPEEAAAHNPVQSDEHQRARTHFTLAQWLTRNGHAEAAERHFVTAGELAPHDFTIRRGSLPIRGISPRGDEFRDIVRDWVGRGNRYYESLPE